MPSSVPSRGHSWKGAIVQRAALDVVNDRPDKAVQIWSATDRKPILAAGNADGDLHMLWYSQTSPYQSLQLLLRHDDGKREYAYDTGAEKVQQLAVEHNWQVISMQQDFHQVFAFE
jgi:hypothetical protein